MAYTARELIIDSYYLSTLVSKKLETVTGNQITDGFKLLNDLLADKATDTGLIPFYREYTFNTVVGREKYNIPGLVADETLTFNIGDVRMPTQNANRKGYFGSARVDGTQSLPNIRHFERVKDGCDLYLYFVPNAVYPIKIWGKFMLSEVPSLSYDMRLVYERGYLNYVRYKLSDFICSENNITFPYESAQQLSVYEKKLKNTSPKDWSVSKLSTLSKSRNFSWAYVNFPGWTT
jgi:hypothetical protein